MSEIRAKAESRDSLGNVAWGWYCLATGFAAPVLVILGMAVLTSRASLLFAVVGSQFVPRISPDWLIVAVQLHDGPSDSADISSSLVATSYSSWRSVGSRQSLSSC
jgi:Cu/Ag efflux pump CusA